MTREPVAESVDWELMAKRVAAAFNLTNPQYGEWERKKGGFWLNGYSDSTWFQYDLYSDGAEVFIFGFARCNDNSIVFWPVIEIGCLAAQYEPILAKGIYCLRRLSENEELAEEYPPELFDSDLQSYIERCNALGITHGWENEL